MTLGHLGVRAICARVVHQLAATEHLAATRTSPKAPGFAVALARVMTDLRLAKLGPDAVRSVAPDLMPLFEAHELDLAEGGFTDWAGLLTAATDALTSDSFTHRLINLPTILLDVPVTNEAELSFVRALSLRIPELLIIAPAADERTLTRVQEGFGRRSTMRTPKQLLLELLGEPTAVRWRGFSDTSSKRTPLQPNRQILIRC